MKKLLACFNIGTISMANTASASGNYQPEEVRAAIRDLGGPERYLMYLANRTGKMAGQRVDGSSEILGSVSSGKNLIVYIRLTNLEKTTFQT
jgi:hypothetical protein